jgi:small subunit ribosomal protein S7
MSRRNISKKRFPQMDSVYNSYLVNLIISKILKSGKKNLAQKIVYKAFHLIQTRTNNNPLIVFENAIRKASPLVEVKSRRIGGSMNQVPVEISGFRSTNLALRWIIKYSKEKTGRTMAIKLAGEMIDAANGIGQTIKKKEEVHRMAEANKTFAHIKQ